VARDLDVDVVAPVGSCAKTSWTVTTPGFYYAFDDFDDNPPVLVCAGQTYTFHLQATSADHPFCIRKAGSDEDAPGVVNNCTTGTIDVVWTIPPDAAGTADYRCMVHLFGNTFVIH